MVESAFLVLVASTLTKGFGFLREIALAAYFGTSATLDVYLLASLIPYLALGLVGAAISNVGVPLTIKRSRSGRPVDSFVWSVFHLLALVLGVLAVAGMLFARPLGQVLGLAHDQARLDLMVRLTRYMMPMVIFLGLSNWCSSILQAKQQFWAPSLVGLPYNAVLITSTIASGYWFGVTGLAAGTSLAMLAQLVFLVFALHRSRTPYKLVLNLRDSDVREVFKVAWPVLIGAGVDQVNTLVDRMLAAGLAAGRVSALSFADRFLSQIVSVLLAPVLTVIYPRLSLTADRPVEFASLVTRGVGLIAFVTVPTSAFLVVVGVPLIQVLFQRGAFDASAVTLTSGALVCYVLGLPGIGLRNLMLSAHYAFSDTFAPMLNGILVVVVNIGLNLILVRYLGHVGLALGSAIAVTAGAILLLINLRRHLHDLRIDKIGWRFFRILIASVLSAVGAAAVGKVMPLSTAAGTVGHLKLIVCCAIVFTIGYVVLCLTLRVDEIHWAFGKAKALWQKYLGRGKPVSEVD